MKLSKEQRAALDFAEADRAAETLCDTFRRRAAIVAIILEHEDAGSEPLLTLRVNRLPFVPVMLMQALSATLEKSPEFLAGQRVQILEWAVELIKVVGGEAVQVRRMWDPGKED